MGISKNVMFINILQTNRIQWSNKPRVVLGIGIVELHHMKPDKHSSQTEDAIEWH